MSKLSVCTDIDVCCLAKAFNNKPGKMHYFFAWVKEHFLSWMVTNYVSGCLMSWS